MFGTDVTAATIASTTSGRRPSLKFGTHSTSLFIPAPHDLSALESCRTKVYSREIRNLAVIRDVVNGNISLLSNFERAKALTAAHCAGAVHGCGYDRFCGRHPHLRASEREHKLHIECRRRAGIEVCRQRDRRSVFDQLPCGSIVRCAEHE